MKEVVFCGIRPPFQPENARVWANGRPYQVRSGLYPQGSPETFPAWGFLGERTFNLAWSLLQTSTGSIRAADKWFKEFAMQVLASLPDRWALTGQEIDQWYRAARPCFFTSPEVAGNAEKKMVDPGSGGLSEPGRGAPDNVQRPDMAPSEIGAG